MAGLLVNGRLIQVPGLEIISPGQEPWAKLDSADYGLRGTSWVRQITLHTTKGKWPQHVKPGKGPGGKDRAVADFWRKDPHHSAAQLVVDNDGSIVCLCDLGKYAAWHNSSFKLNRCAIGIEMYQEADGGVYEAVYESTVRLVLALCDIFGIPLQGPSLPYKNAPIRRLELGDDSVVGVYGHRDITHNRGHGDPGEEIWTRLRAAGLMGFDIQAKAELAYWSRIQARLNTKYHANLSTDGVCGPNTVRVLRKYGLWNGGIFVEDPV